MSSTVYPKDRIEREAKDAAERGESIAEACPYPFGTPAALHFVACYALALPRRTAAQAGGQRQGSAA